MWDCFILSESSPVAFKGKSPASAGHGPASKHSELEGVQEYFHPLGSCTEIPFTVKIFWKQCPWTQENLLDT